MSMRLVYNTVTDSFYSFMSDGGARKSQKFCECTGLCLMDYIASWVEFGDGVEACAGDFQMYLMAIIVITNDWHQIPDLLDEAGKGSVYRTTSFSEREHSCHADQDDADWNHRAFDQHWFAQQVFHYHEARRS